jgi:hypothetical protein
MAQTNDTSCPNRMLGKRLPSVRSASINSSRVVAISGIVPAREGWPPRSAAAYANICSAAPAYGVGHHKVARRLSGRRAEYQTVMPAPIAKAYVDRIFDEKNLGEIWAVRVVEQDRPLPEEFWLFCHIYAWAPARSGVWQYYDGLPDELFKRVGDDLDRFGLFEIAEIYRLGRRTWDGPTQAAEVDRWLDSHADEIHDAIFKLIAAKRDFLTNETEPAAGGTAADLLRIANPRPPLRPPLRPLPRNRPPLAPAPARRQAVEERLNHEDTNVTKKAGERIGHR